MLGTFFGPVLFLAILFWPGADATAPGGLPVEARRLAAVTALMATYWLTQAIPIAATSLIPLAAFPLLGIQTAADVSKAYIKSSIFLFLGGFLIALGIERWGLHRRIALHIVRWLGTSPRRVVLGFMLATAFLSMWISNTASTLLMLPIGLALLTSLRELLPTDGAVEGPSSRPFDSLSVVLMLGIAYSASIGGLSTLVGTPTNITFSQIWRDLFADGPEISAGHWMTAVVPLGAVLLIGTWAVLVARLPQIPELRQFGRSFFTDRLRELGCPRRPELLMLAVFVATALLWMLRKDLTVGNVTLVGGWGDAVAALLVRTGSEPEFAKSAVDDSTVAMGMALLLFVLPAGRSEDGKRQRLMDWQTAQKVPWGILLLIGGGFALAGAFSSTGLSEWLGQWLARVLSGQPDWILVGSSCLAMTFLTEFTTNVATVSAVLPILADASSVLEIDPRLIMIPATISTSCAFMLPIATPPNAIVFGSGKVSVGQMARYGILLNLLGTLLITMATFVLLVPQFGIATDGIPPWAAGVSR